MFESPNGKILFAFFFHLDECFPSIFHQTCAL